MMKSQIAPPVPDSIIPHDLVDDSASTAATVLNNHRHGNGTPPEMASAAATELARARWASESEYEDEVKEHFASIPLEEGLSLLAKMRSRCELAARTIEKRRTEETLNTACAVCGVKKSQLGNRNWRMVSSHKDSTTGTYVTDYFCSDACLVENNRRKHGISALSDRGMLPGDDPARAKNSIIAHQEKVKRDAELAEAGKKASRSKKQTSEES